MRKVCSKCREEKDESEFYKNRKLSDGFQKYCKVCKDEVDKKRLTPDKQKLANLSRVKKSAEKVWSLKAQKGGKCQKCGDSRLHVLEFHHIDPKQKIDQVNNLVQFYGEKNWHIAEKEADKCILLCSNCHKDFHYLERENNITLENYLGVAELVRH